MQDIIEEEEEQFNQLSESVIIESLELLNCQMDCEGGSINTNIKGSLSFKIMNPAVNSISIKTKCDSKEVSLRVPPAFDKKRWTNEGVIIPKDL